MEFVLGVWGFGGIIYLADVMKYVHFHYTKELSRFQHCSIVMGWLPEDCLLIPF